MHRWLVALLAVSAVLASVAGRAAAETRDVKELFFKVGQEVINKTNGEQQSEISISFCDRYAWCHLRKSRSSSR